MATKLERLLEEIDPSRTVDIVDRQVNNAINSFRHSDGQITDWNKFQQYLVDFYDHIQNKIFNFKVSPNFDMSLHQCCKIFNKKYGHNGEKTAFEMARTGNEGGLYAVLKTLGEEIAHKYVEMEIASKVYDFRESLPVNEFLDASWEYINKYKKYLPCELTEGSAARIRANFTQVLENHPWMMKDIRNVGR